MYFFLNFEKENILPILGTLGDLNELKDYDDVVRDIQTHTQYNSADVNAYGKC